MAARPLDAPPGGEPKTRSGNPRGSGIRRAHHHDRRGRSHGQTEQGHMTATREAGGDSRPPTPEAPRPRGEGTESPARAISSSGPTTGAGAISTDDSWRRATPASSVSCRVRSPATSIYFRSTCPPCLQHAQLDEASDPSSCQEVELRRFQDY
ncbi:hypothetical protein EJB05_40068, partial [Eragrostis curvula]